MIFICVIARVLDINCFVCLFIYFYFFFFVPVVLRIYYNIRLFKWWVASYVQKVGEVHILFTDHDSRLYLYIYTLAPIIHILRHFSHQ